MPLEDKLKEKSIQFFLPPIVCPVESSPLELSTSDKQEKDFEKLINEYFSTNLINSIRTEAIEVLGLDESELTAISPIHIEDYYYDWEEVEQKLSLWLALGTSGRVRREDVFKKDDNVLVGIGYQDKKLRSSAYQVTWIFPTLKRLSVYQKIFFLHKKETDETTRMFVWKHITSITATQNTINTKGKSEKVDIFKIVVPGDEFICTMNTTEYTKRAIQAMKAVWTSNVE